MERIKEYLMELARDIKDEIDEHDNPEDLEALEMIAEMCEDYNEIYKMYCHHTALKDGMDPRAAGHHDVMPGVTMR